MAVNFHPLKLKEVKKETRNCVSLCFDIPESLKETFRFKEGQNITIRKNINGEEIRRSYSICAAPYENELRVAVKEISGGLFSSFANSELKTGDTLEVLAPVGNFNAKLANKAANYLAIAAGSGITPVISIIKHTLATQPDSTFNLIYGNRNRQSIIFFEELEALKNKYMSRFNLIHILSRERTDADINYGRITSEKLNALKPLVNFEQMDGVYLCGPNEMIFEIKDFLEKNNFSSDKIHFELFNTPGQNKAKASESVVDSGEKSKVSIKVDGRVFELSLGYNENSILDAALQTGADLPYACKGGVCCSCRAKVLEGKVEMDVNYALEKEEVEQGFILTCQAHPRTDKVVIDFDVR